MKAGRKVQNALPVVNDAQTWRRKGHDLKMCERGRKKETPLSAIHGRRGTRRAIRGPFACIYIRRRPCTPLHVGLVTI